MQGKKLDISYTCIYCAVHANTKLMSCKKTFYNLQNNLLLSLSASWRRR